MRTEGRKLRRRRQPVGCVCSPNPTAGLRLRAAGAKGLLRLVVLLALTPAASQAQFNCTTNNGAITIKGYTGAGGAVTIPDTISGLPVTSIGDGAFYMFWPLTSITIPGSVTNIGSFAFFVCTNLTSVTIPNRLTSIGAWAFCGCDSLASVTIPSSVTNIGGKAFWDCFSLTAITVEALNSAYLSVDGVLFNQSQTTLIQCPGGKAGDYTMPQSVTNIVEGGFYGCTRLNSVALGNNVLSIGDMAFEYCTGLTAINVDALNSVYSSVAGVLFNQSQTTLIQCPKGKAGGYTLPDQVTDIGSGAFGHCTRLTSVKIGNSVTNIGNGVFSYCSSLTNATIGTAVTSFGDYAFNECSNLKGVYCKGNAPTAGSGLFSGNSKATVFYMSGTTGWGPTFGGRPTALWLWVEVSILIPPQTQTTEIGSAAYFSVQTVGSPPPTYQWFFNDSVPIGPPTTNAVLELSNVQPIQAGNYAVVVANLGGAVTSAPAMLNVIPRVERRFVPAIKLIGATGSLMQLEYIDSLLPPRNWQLLADVSLTGASGYYFDLTMPLPPQRFLRARQAAPPDASPDCQIALVPALTLTGTIGSPLRVDYINRVGPVDAWVTLDTVTLTNTSQLYFDLSAPGQPTRLYRLVPVP